MIRAVNLHYTYAADSPAPVRALQGIDLEFRPGEFTVLFGHNGCGKSTLAKHLNALLQPTQGEVWVDGLDTRDRRNLWEIRQRVGMVFQNPDNQIVATVVEDDIAFGAENLGVPPAAIQERVDEALARLGIAGLRDKAPHLLSGGQKQRVAIAGVMAMRSRYIVLDEPTSLLDPEGRAEVVRAAARLAREEGLGVILITHFMEEAVAADRVVVMDAGRVVLQGPPREVFTRVEELRALRLDVPLVTQVAARLRTMGAGVRPDILSVEELVGELCRS